MDASAFERLQTEQNQLVRTAHEVHGELEVASQECNIIVHLFEKKAEGRGPLKGALWVRPFSSSLHFVGFLGATHLSLLQCRRLVAGGLPPIGACR